MTSPQIHARQAIKGNHADGKSYRQQYNHGGTIVALDLNSLRNKANDVLRKQNEVEEAERVRKSITHEAQLQKERAERERHLRELPSRAEAHLKKLLNEAAEKGQRTTRMY